MRFFFAERPRLRVVKSYGRGRIRWNDEWKKGNINIHVACGMFLWVVVKIFEFLVRAVLVENIWEGSCEDF